MSNNKPDQPLEFEIYDILNELVGDKKRYPDVVEATGSILELISKQKEDAGHCYISGKVYSPNKKGYDPCECHPSKPTPPDQDKQYPIKVIDCWGCGASVVTEKPETNSKEDNPKPPIKDRPCNHNNLEFGCAYCEIVRRPAMGDPVKETQEKEFGNCPCPTCSGYCVCKIPGHHNQVQSTNNPIAKLSKDIGVKLSQSQAGQRELIRETRNKINELVSAWNSKLEHKED